MDSCAGGLRRTVVRIRAAKPDALAGTLSVGSRQTGAGREQPALTWVARSNRWAYEDRIGYRGPQWPFTSACRVRGISVGHRYKSWHISTIRSRPLPQPGPQANPQVNAPPCCEPMASRRGRVTGKGDIAQGLGTVAQQNGQDESTA